MNIMLDLETLGTKPGCVILSIGAVAFDPKGVKLGAEFYVEINTQDSISSGLNTDSNTLNWWSKQDEQAQELLERCDQSQTTLYQALDDFSGWIAQFSSQSKQIIWANDPSFDCNILREPYEMLGLNTPWQHYNERSCRTMVGLGREFGIDPKKHNPFIGIPHHALNDAKHQAKYIRDIHHFICGSVQERRFLVNS